MAMSTFITLAIYILGVWSAYFQLQRWNKKDLSTNEEYQTLFMLSMLSWAIYPIYGLVWLFRKASEEE